MAGSLSHIVAEDGTFQMELISNMGDAHEALEECHQIIAYLLRDNPNGPEVLAETCRELSFPETDHIPIIQLDLLPRHAPIWVKLEGSK